VAKASAQLRVAVATTILSPYELDIVRGVIRYSDHAGPWRFVGANNMPYAAFDALDLTQLDGVIGGFYTPKWADDVARAGIAAVNTSNSLGGIGLPRVGCDESSIARLAAEHLLERGYPHFGFVVRGDNWYSQRRLEGFRAAIAHDAGRDCHVLEPPAGSAEDDPEPILPWLKRLPRPIGIMAANDVRGRQVIDAAAALGLRVPEDVGVIGVDNDEFASALAAWPLSSVQIDGRTTGYRAAAMLDALIAGEAAPSPQWVQPVGIVARHSTDVTINQDAVVTEALRFIQDHCHEPIVVEDVLAQVAVSRTTLEVRMKRATGKTPQVAISSARIDRAKRRLIQTADPLERIARDCGYARREQFHVVFKRITGMSPGQFRQQGGR